MIHDIRKVLIILSCILCSLFVNAQLYKTQALSNQIHTIQINANGNWLDYPIINLNSSDYIQLNFDRIADNSNARLRYKLIHCNADWSPSSLSDIQFLNGFNDNLLDDYAISVNTRVNYTNFLLDIPNNDVSLKLSGNYTVLVYEEDNPNKILLTACFSVVDTQVSVSAQVSGKTDIDVNREHQQISFSLDCNNIRLFNPRQEIKVYVRQNNRLDNEKRLIEPTFIQGSKLVYENNRSLIFEAGNEYRRFESISYRYNGLNIEQTNFKNPYYYTYLIPTRSRANSIYSYDQDQNGRFMIRNGEVNLEDADTEADYFYTTFTLQKDEPLLENIYINGAFTNNTFSDRYLMSYDHEKRAYFLTLLLKQGAYNYQFLTKKGATYSPAQIEGNYFETENEYTIYIYHRAPGQRYDSLINFSKVIYK